ncbi:unnamed protein product, partial [Adineta steineri]
MDEIKKHSHVTVIAATNRFNATDSGLYSFDCKVYLDIPDSAGRLKILRILIQYTEIADTTKTLQSISAETHGYVGADLASSISKAVSLEIKEKMGTLVLQKDAIDGKVLNSLVVTKHNFLSALNQSNPSALRKTVVVVSTTTWGDIGGLDSVKRELQTLVQYAVEHSEKFLNL